MAKKLIMLAMAVGAFVAFAAPAMAQAAPILTHAGGGAFEPGEVVTATNDPADPVVTSITEVGTLACEEIDLSIEVTENTETTTQGEGSGFTSFPCFLNGSTAVPVTGVTVSNIDLQNNGTGSGSFTFIYDTENGSCTLGGTVGLTYAHNSNTVTIVTPNALTGSAGCPPAGEISGSLILDEAEIM